MLNKTIDENKKNGIYYTPSPLAEFLAKPLINKSNLSVFDPAYGKGSLLLAAINVFNKFAYSQKCDLDLNGCDIMPVNGALCQLNSSNLLKCDFFKYPYKNKFDVILMNPPYVRHHHLKKEKIKAYQHSLSKKCNLNLKSDLWAYFLVKSARHVKKGGSIGAILPWSFLQADYAQNIRYWLSESFGEINVIALGAEYFDNANERIVLVWLKKYGGSCKSIEIAYAKDIEEKVSFFELELDKWKSERVIISEKYDTDQILSKYIQDYGFSYFENYADVKIGVVTGADNYFIISESAIKKLGFSNEYLIPIITSSKEFSGLYNKGNIKLKRLININGNDFDNFKNYIKIGEEKQYNLRAHSLLRNPWYSINIGETPDAFFPYRMSRIPYLVINNRKTQCTNSIHRIYFKELSEVEIKWIQVSLLSAVGQLSLERFSKTYGRGMLKIEPKSLKKSLVYKDSNPSINSIYSEICDQLVSGNKSDAMRIATEFINNKLCISNDLSELAERALVELQDRRLDR